MTYTIYNSQSGKIIKVVSCNISQLPAQLSGEDYAFIDGAFNDEQFYVLDNIPISITPKPSDHHIFNYTTKQWEDPRTAEQITDDLESSIVKATQARLDAFARTRNYDGILSAATYATSAVAKFATEGQYCVTARDSTWAALYTMLAEVQAGSRPMPAGYIDIEPLLPILTWPT